MNIKFVFLFSALLFQCSAADKVVSLRGSVGGEKNEGNATPGDPPAPSSPGSGSSANSGGSTEPLPPYPSGLLAPEDFTFLGSYSVSIDPQMTYSMGITLRYVNNELRFLAPSYSGPVGVRLIEFKLPSTGFGSNITAAQKTNQWDNIYNPHDPTNNYLRPGTGGGDAYSFWWEDMGNEKGRLWTTHAIDYPDDVNMYFTQNIAVRDLNANGTISNHFYEYGLEGIGQRAIYGGVQKIPESFRAENGLTNQPYLVGWGGYASRMAQGFVPSMGLMAVAIPDVTTYPVSNSTQIPASAFKILADHRSGTTHAMDWYKNPGSPINFDMGTRNSDVLSYFGGGGDINFPPPATNSWLSPAPDGKGRWVWGDSFFNTGNWIVGENKQGFIAIGAFSAGRAYYAGSTLNRDRRHAELQIFDPRDFAEVLKGKKNPWNVQPVASKLLTGDLEPLGLLWGGGNNTAPGSANGAAYDAKTKTLWLWCPMVNRGYGIRLVAYRVNI